jgi:hypothetical protein
MSGIKIASGFQATNPATGAVTLGLPTGAITFKPGGTANENVYTDPLILEQAAQTTVGVLGPKTVYVDFTAAGDTYTAAAALDLGSSTALCGVVNQGNSSAIPTLAMGSHQLSAPVAIADLRITGTGAGPVFSSNPSNLEISGRSQLAGALFYTSPTGGFFNIVASEDTILGDGSTPIVAIANGASVSVWLLGFSSLSANAFTFTGTAQLTIFKGADATLDGSYLNNAAVTILSAPNEGEYTFMPGGSAGLIPMLFTSIGLLSVAIVAGPTVPVTVNVDCSLNGDSYMLAADLNLGNEASLIGLTNQSTDSPPALSTAGFTISPPVRIENMTFAVSTAAAVLATFRSLELLDAILESIDGNLYTTIQNFGTTTIIARNSQIGDGIQPVIAVPAGGLLNLTLLDGSSLKAAAIPVTATGTVNIFAAPGAQYDASYLTIPGVRIFLAHPQARSSSSRTQRRPRTFTASQRTPRPRHNRRSGPRRSISISASARTRTPPEPI